ncbi:MULTISPECIES: alpha/beta fold hydrolase [unclassified Prochlorococcus]|uniref:alpha/beta fold hydrolase n=1 Tax=unclassified Prochlorococcus TaxID=2627481 RepID=UPI00053393C4|nr:MULTISPECIES: alpha/beta hydrolase [unclassified Prochlorococcus]KGG15434.1 putative alpha/beta hydrolase [Prochlorococcus sp. MIT 0602]KGG17713.1 putative alpha/beta hydrolase [Prochlorococcus sp. MIT 0603]
MTTSKESLEKVSKFLIDPLAIKLTESIRWLKLDNISTDQNDLYPIAILGKGKPILLLHGFDSCFLEFRRLIPYLQNNFKLIIPDLYGFGFCPRPHDNNYGKKMIINHLENLLKTLKTSKGVGVIGASMGGGIAIELARSLQVDINKLLLLSPAGLIGNPTPIPPPLDVIGACFLKQNFVRDELCKKAFSNPKDVGPPEKQIASIHVNVAGWKRSLAAFARGGGIANCALPLPNQPMSVLWGQNDRILSEGLRKESTNILNCPCKELENCGHLPHIDQPELVAKQWKTNF